MHNSNMSFTFALAHYSSNMYCCNKVPALVPMGFIFLWYPHSKPLPDICFLAYQLSRNGSLILGNLFLTTGVIISSDLCKVQNDLTL